jgi:hypothetical protein
MRRRVLILSRHARADACEFVRGLAGAWRVHACRMHVNPRIRLLRVRALGVPRRP